MSEEKIKACPFCENEKLVISGGSTMWVTCNKCYALGPEAESESEALELWNNRVGTKRKSQVNGKTISLVESKKS